MAKFNLGDKVRVSFISDGDTFTPVSVGATGTVVALSCGNIIGVYFDEDIAGHNCKGTDAERLGDEYFHGCNCWWFGGEELDVVSDIRDRMNEIQTKFAEMYSTTGLVGISSKYVQVTSEFFKEMFDTYTVAPHGNSKTKVLLSAKYNGVEYIALDER